MSKLDYNIMRCNVIIVRRCQHCSATTNGVPCLSKLDHDIMRSDVFNVRRCQHCSAMSTLLGDVNVARRCQRSSAMSTLFGDVIIVRRQLIYMFIAVSYGITLSGWPRFMFCYQYLCTRQHVHCPA